MIVYICVDLFNLQEYRILFEESGNNPGDKTLEDKFFEHEVCTGPDVSCCRTYLVFGTVGYY